MSRPTLTAGPTTCGCRTPSRASYASAAASVARTSGRTFRRRACALGKPGETNCVNKSRAVPSISSLEPVSVFELLLSHGTIGNSSREGHQESMRIESWSAVLRGAAIPGHRATRASEGPNGSGMNQTWYVTFEVPKCGTLSKRRHPRLTETFETEAEARDFARTKFNRGLIVTAGTINPERPRKAIASVEIPVWVESGQALEMS